MPTSDTTSTKVYQSVPMVHVADVQRSLDFYERLGFACESTFPAPDGSINWAAIRSGQARLFLTRGTQPVVASQQAVLFYMYSQQIEQLRTELLAAGLADAGEPPMPDDTRDFSGEPQTSCVFQLRFPFYMPEGELRLHDPDGYCILIGKMDD